VASGIGHPQTADLIRCTQQSPTISDTPGGDIRLAMARSAEAVSRGDLPVARRVLRLADPGKPSARPQAGFLRAERIGAADRDGGVRRRPAPRCPRPVRRSAASARRWSHNS